MTVTLRTLTVDSVGNGDAIDLTGAITRELQGSGVQSGTVTVFVKHTTAAITLIEVEPGLLNDYKAWWDTVVPREYAYKHNPVDGETTVTLTSARPPWSLPHYPLHRRLHDPGHLAAGGLDGLRHAGPSARSRPSGHRRVGEHTASRSSPPFKPFGRAGGTNNDTQVARLAPAPTPPGPPSPRDR